MKKIFIWIFCGWRILNPVSAQTPTSFLLNENGGASIKLDNNAIYFSTNGKLIKSDYQGNILWSKSNLPLPRFFSDGYYYSLSGNYNTHIEKIDTAGNPIWKKDISQTVCPLIAGSINLIKGFAVSNDRIFISSCQFNSNSEGQNALLTLDTSGNIVGSWCDYASFSSNRIQSPYTARNGKTFLVYSHGGVGIEQSILKVNHDGTIDSITPSIEIDMGVTVAVQNIIQMADSSYLAVCNISNTIQMNYQGNYIGLSKFREDGTIIWQELLAPTGDSAIMMNGVTTDSLGNIYIVGDGGNDVSIFMFSIKLNGAGGLLSVKKLVNPLWFQLKNLFHKNSLICCAVNCMNGNSLNPGMIVFDSAFLACSITDSLLPIIVSQDQQWNGQWFSFPQIGYSLLPDTPGIPANAAIPLVFDLCQVLNTHEFQKEESINIFPNPFQNNFKVETGTSEKHIIIICDVVGRVIYKEEFYSDAFEISLPEIPNGVYEVKISSKTKNITRKIVKI